METNTSICTLTEYLDIISYLKKAYPQDALINNPVSNTFIYRGQSNDFPLLPSIFRKTSHLIPTKNGKDRELENNRYLWAQEEITILKDFRRQACNYIENVAFCDMYRWAEYAQHYGIPTRFLDWTYNPLVALYFACKYGSADDAVVWILHTLNYLRYRTNYLQSKKIEDKPIYQMINELISNKSDIELPFLYDPYYSDPRMNAQSSLFMVWGTRQESFEKMIPADVHMIYRKENVGFFSYGIEEEKRFIFKIIVPSSYKQPFLRELDNVGINEKTLFPGLDGLGRYLEWKYRFEYSDILG